MAGCAPASAPSVSQQPARMPTAIVIKKTVLITSWSLTLHRISKDWPTVPALGWIPEHAGLRNRANIARLQRRPLLPEQSRLRGEAFWRRECRPPVLFEFASALRDHDR